MKGCGQVPGNIVLTNDSMINDGSETFGAHATIQKAGGTLASLDRGIVGEGSVVYLNIGKEAGAKPGDLFIVFRDSRVVNGRTAIAEVVILRVEERSSSALVTYSDDAVSL